MELILTFLSKFYFIFLILAVLFLLALIGFIADNKNKKKLEKTQAIETIKADNGIPSPVQSNPVKLDNPMISMNNNTLLSSQEENTVTPSQNNTFIPNVESLPSNSVSPINDLNIVAEQGNQVMDDGTEIL